MGQSNQQENAKQEPGKNPFVLNYSSSSSRTTKNPSFSSYPSGSLLIIDEVRNVGRGGKIGKKIISRGAMSLQDAKLALWLSLFDL